MRCPRCRSEVENCPTVPSEVRDSLLNHQSADAVFSRACEACLTVLQQLIATPSLIENKMDPVDLKKMIQWRSRGDLIKTAMMALKDFNYEQALVNYLAYIKILEETFGKSRSELTPEVFEALGKSDELSTYIFVLWDLISIYDRELPEKQAEVCQEFAVLIKSTPFVETMARKARVAARTARNPAIYKQLNKDLGGGRSCFVATAVFGNTFAPEVLALREFRDHYLEQRLWGRWLTKLYYLLAPSLGVVIQKNSRLARSLRPPLRALALHLGRKTFVPTFEIYTDGSFARNMGSWAFVILKNNQIVLESSGRVRHTSSLKMEYQAVIEALRKVPPDSRAQILTDSRVLVTTVTKNLANLQERGFRKKSGKLVSEHDQLQELAALLAERQVTWRWIPAHRGLAMNERCDELCTQARALGGTPHRELDLSN